VLLGHCITLVEGSPSSMAQSFLGWVYAADVVLDRDHDLVMTITPPRIWLPWTDSIETPQTLPVGPSGFISVPNS
jgi:hypothetical protein